jgi:acyl-CoA thioesterase I
MVRKIVAVVLLSLAVGCGRDDRPPGGGAPADSGVTAGAPAIDDRPAVLFLGTSLTAGLGVSRDSAFPAIIQRKLDSAGLALRVINGGESGGTSAGGVRRIEWFLDQPIAVLVLELGANDGLRGLDVDTLIANLDMIIDTTRSVHPDVEVVVVGMQAPPNLGERYTSAFRSAYTTVAESRATELIPFLLEGVGGIPSLNQSDGIHPNEKGHRVVAENVWRVLRPVAQRVVTRRSAVDSS